MKKIVKLITAMMLLLCLVHMPYGYYEFVRFVAAAVFAFLSYDYFKSKNEGFGFTFAALTLLFQPIIKIALGRAIWNIVDVAVAIGLIVSIFISYRENKI